MAPRQALITQMRVLKRDLKVLVCLSLVNAQVCQLAPLLLLLLLREPAFSSMLVILLLNTNVIRGTFATRLFIPIREL